MTSEARPLSPEARALAGDPANVAYARRLAARLSANLPWLRDEIEGAAMVGLCEAARSFDPARGLRFRTHAHRRIVGAIKDELRVSGLVKGSRVKKINPHCESIDAAIAGDGKDVSLAATLESGEHPVGWEAESEDGVSEITRHLPARNKRAIRLLYCDCRAANLKLAGKVLGLSETRMSQLVTGGIEMIRESLNGHATAVLHVDLESDEDEVEAPADSPVLAPDDVKAKSRYRGVSRESQGRWSARVHVTGKGLKYLGTFSTEEEAARAYDRAAIGLGKPATRLNFPDEAPASPMPVPSPPPVARVAESPAPSPVLLPAPAIVTAPILPSPAGDPEVEAIAAVARALSGLDVEATRRVIDWAIARFSRRQAS